MVLNRRVEPPDLLVATLSGVLTPDDQAQFVEWVRESIRVVGAVRVLIVLEQYVGRLSDARYDDAACWLGDDEAVSKIAIVGKSEWRIPVLTLIVQPLRLIPIEYFLTERAARRWLDASAGRTTGRTTRATWI